MCLFVQALVVFFHLGSARQWLGEKFGRVSKLYTKWVSRLGTGVGVVELLVGDLGAGGQGVDRGASDWCSESEVVGQAMDIGAISGECVVEQLAMVEVLDCEIYG